MHTSLSIRICAQSSFDPCYANEISVVLQSNVPLCAKGCMSQITISHFDGAEAASGPLEIRPFDSSDEQHLTFSNAPRGKGGHGLWNNANKTLVLFMTCCMECNKDYRFRFTVKNPGEKCALSVRTLRVFSLCTSRSLNVLIQRGANPRLYTRTHGTHTHTHTHTHKPHNRLWPGWQGSHRGGYKCRQPDCDCANSNAVAKRLPIAASLHAHR